MWNVLEYIVSMARNTPIAFEQDTELCAGSIIACLAPNDMFWLAQTCDAVDAEDVRWQVRWLEEVKSSTSKNQNGISYRLSQHWDETTIWRDCVLSDVTSLVKNDSKGVWTVHTVLKQQLLLLIQQSQYPAKSAAVSLINPNITTSGHSSADSGDLTVPDNMTISSFMKTCNDAITLVCLFYFLMLYIKSHFFIRIYPNKFVFA